MSDDFDPEIALNAFQANKDTWAVTDTMFKPGNLVVAKLPAGVYYCGRSYSGEPIFNKIEIKNDDLIVLESTILQEVAHEIADFWTRASMFKKHGFLHRRGYLLYGPPGTGKSSLLYQLANKITEDGHIAIFTKDINSMIYCINNGLRKLEPDRKILCMIEDIDEHVGDNGSDSNLLQWLDGSDKIDSVVVIGTTNYPEKMDRRLIARPRRFDRLIPIGLPNYAVRLQYFTKKLQDDYSDAELREWAELTDGLSLAALADVIVSVCCMGKDLHESVSIVKKVENSSTISSAQFKFADEVEDTDDLLPLSDEDLPVDQSFAAQLMR